MQGSGKGTQAKILVQKYGYKLFETGAELRAMAKSESELGQRIKTIMNEGKLVDNNIIMEIIEAFCFNIDENDHVIFDGIPRNMEQMEKFEIIMQKIGRNPMGLNIKLSHEKAMGRLLKRFTCEGVDTTNNPLITEEQCIALGGKVTRRSDDNEQAIRARLEAFDNETQPVIDAYEKLKKLIEIRGIQSVEEVNKEIIDVIK